jgi:Flp pilus assembly protein TadG
MAASQHHLSLSGNNTPNESGQATLEFAIVALLMLLLFFVTVDFGRAIYDIEVMSGLTRQGSNLASRGSDLSTSATAVVSGDSPLDLTHNGEVVITSVTNINRVNTITGQVSLGGISQNSRVGMGIGSRASVPTAATTMLQPNQTIYITEVFYSFRPVTPIANVLHTVMPSILYQAAYF